LDLIHAAPGPIAECCSAQGVVKLWRLAHCLPQARALPVPHHFTDMLEVSLMAARSDARNISWKGDIAQECASDAAEKMR
jgi:hypothetical protein